MLVNVSRFTAVQNRVADLLHLELEEIRRAIRLYGALGPDRAAAESSEILALARTFEDEFAGCGFSWAHVLAALHDAIAPVRVQAVNQGTGAASLDYSVTDKPPGVRVIAVGGNSLSRGLTLEGLSTSYFLRNAKAYDTLLQMGRWFGYRDGYAGSLPAVAHRRGRGLVQHVTRSDSGTQARLRSDEAAEGNSARVRPARPDAPRHVDHHGAQQDGDGRRHRWRTRDFVDGPRIESSRLYSDRQRNQENFEIIERFFSSVVSVHGQSATIASRGRGPMAECPCERDRRAAG